jgi:Bifunctional DNA primase/polymerase, N-terminal
MQNQQSQTTTKSLSVASTTNLVDAALQYRELGWTTLPAIGKQPCMRYAAKFPTPYMIMSFLRRPETTGLVVLLGERSGGLTVRDFDNVDSYRRWADECPDLAAILPTVRTRSGYHVYARSAGPFRTKYLGAGEGELRANKNSYVLAPPSLHPSGSTYAWPIEPYKNLPVVDQATLAGSWVAHKLSMHPANRSSALYCALIQYMA